MDLVPLFTTHLSQHYALAIQELHPLDAELAPDRWLARLDQTNGLPLLVRAYRSDRPVPDCLSGCGSDDTPSWLSSRAATLKALEAWDYPAPRVVPTRAGRLTSAVDGWSALVTTYVPGQIANLTSATAQSVGRILGQLHRISVRPPHVQHEPIGRAWLHHALAVPRARVHYAAVAADIPSILRPLHEALLAALATFEQRTDLPVAVLHGDTWAGNLVQIDGTQCMLIDWELSGIGLAVLDLGRLLLFCHEDVDPPSGVWLRPEAWRIHGVVDGYCAERVPDAIERTALPAAMRYGVAIEAASEFTRAQRRGWDADSQERLRVRQHWSTICGEIADTACARLAQYAG